MIRVLVLIATLTATLTSCSSRQFYDKVSTGKIIGQPYVMWQEPNQFELDNQVNKLFAFQRFNGEIICPHPIKTDGGSIPRTLWNRKGFSPWTYAPGYLIHDWLYEANRRKVSAGISRDGKPLYYDKEKADWILAEVIKTQMEGKQKSYKDPSPARLLTIHWAVKRFGMRAWNGQPTLVEDSLLTPVLTTAISNLPLMPTLNKIGNEFMSPTPDKPDELAGSTTPHWQAAP